LATAAVASSQSSRGKIAVRGCLQTRNRVWAHTPA
jgi:hypothetical protein